MKILTTGAAGFIGSDFVRQAALNGEHDFIMLDALTYSGNLRNIKNLLDLPNCRFVRGRIEDRELLQRLFEEYTFDGVINFAAESHVDRSIIDSLPFVETNIAGTVALLDAARRHNTARFVQISTDEVYGSLGAEGLFTEKTPLAPSSPYSASKAAADCMALAYCSTYGMNISITRCSNNYGPHQFPEKLIPLMILNALEEKPLPVYGDGLNIRDWIHVSDHNKALWQVFLHGKGGETYNIGASQERTNIEIVREILRLTNKPESLIRYVKDRPGHDRRYAIDSGKIRQELGWEPQYSIENGLAETVQWYCDNTEWLADALSGEYLSYYEKQYGNAQIDN